MQLYLQSQLYLEKPYVSSQRQKAIHLQILQLCFYSSKSPEETHFSAQWKKPFKCKQCNYSSTNSGNLKAHMFVHTGEKPLKCKQCDYSCYDSGMLKKHTIALHKGKSPSFATNAYMMHNGERPFSCKECKKSFKEKRDLTAHMYKEHNAELPFICSQCEYACTRADNLKRHEKTHQNGKTKAATFSQIYLAALK